MSQLVLAVLLLQPAAQTPAGAVPSGASARIVVNGATRPDLVPQWSVWAYVFRVFAGGPRQLPSSIAELVSASEQALVTREADAAQKADAVCQERLSKALSRLGPDPAAVVEDRMQDITMGCRRDTLRARDTVLSGVNAEAAAALRAFAESTKSGTSISLPKKKLARFLEPE